MLKMFLGAPCYGCGYNFTKDYYQELIDDGHCTKEEIGEGDFMDADYAKKISRLYEEKTGKKSFFGKWIYC